MTLANVKRTKNKKDSKPFTKEMLLMLNPRLFLSSDVDQNIIINNPIELGRIAEILYAEKLPSLRLWLHYKNYSIGVVPDGVTDLYVYEFKATTLSDKELEKVLEQAIKQNEIYAYAFKRPNIKIQVAKFDLPKGSFPIKVKNLPKPEIISEYRLSSPEKALTILAEFDEGFQIPYIPKQKYADDLQKSISSEDIRFLKNAYSSYGRLSIRHRERRDAEIKFRAKDDILNELIKVFDRTPFIAKKGLDEGYPIVRMYNRKQIVDFLKLLDLKEEYEKFNI